MNRARFLVAALALGFLALLSVESATAQNQKAVGTVDPAEKAQRPLIGKWEGTAPSCDANCGSDRFAFCVAEEKNLGDHCSYSQIVIPDQKGFGGGCLSGHKAFCSPVSEYPQVQDYAAIAAAGGVWRGTAPTCEGSCGDGYFALCRSVDGDSCDFTSAIDISKLPGSFGDDCWSGRKVFCVPTSFLFNVQ
ncbi:hypothetical protein [Nisaea sediminum]|uniref:hypothetical protein n=1 Tax=Nisaea sediminum TaxID=2775867 RepID=UPI0018664AF6|nr:hypothetical protein [Nisaea sediminum]